MKKQIISVILLLTFLFLASCSKDAENGAAGFSVDAMDTVNTITAFENEKKAHEIFAESLEEFDQKWNVASTSSELAILDNSRSDKHLSAESRNLLLKSIELCKETNGNLDITLYPFTRLWGFETDHPSVPNESAISLLVSLCGMDTIHVDGDRISMDEYTMLDLGSTAKGYAADLIAEKLKKEGCNSAVISLGGNVRTIGEKPDGSPWMIALTDPNAPSDSFGALRLEGDFSVVTSGSYQRYFEEDGKRYCHIFDPETGYPVDGDLLSVTVVCKEGIRADAFSTALFVMGAQEAEDFYKSRDDFEMILVLRSGQIKVSEGLKDRFTLEDSKQKINVIER